METGEFEITRVAYVWLTQYIPAVLLQLIPKLISRRLVPRTLLGVNSWERLGRYTPLS
jgi:hypothetical protein